MRQVIDEEEIRALEAKHQYDDIINLLTPVYMNLKRQGVKSLDFLKVTSFLGKAFFFHGEHDKAAEHFLEALNLFSSEESPEFLRLVALNYHYLGTLYSVRGQKKEAYKCLVKARQLREALSDAALWATLNNLAILHETWMEFTDAILLYEEALNKALEIKSQESIVVVLSNLARIVFLRGDHDTAEAYLTQFQDVLTQQLQFESLPLGMQGWITFVEGEINQFKGNISDAVVKYRQAVRMFENIGHYHEMYNSLNRLAYCLLLRGQPHQAYMLVHRCLNGILDQKLLSILPMTLYVQGELLLDMQLHEEALKSFEQLQEVASMHEFQYFEAMSYLGKAKTLWALEKVEAALQCLERALELWRAYDYPILDHAELFFYYSGVLSALGRHEEAIVTLNSASDLLSSCTYQPIIHRILNAYFKGYYFYKRQNWQEAMNYFEESLHLSTRIDQFNMVLRQCFYLIDCHLQGISDEQSTKDRIARGNKAMELLAFLRRVLLSCDPIILTPQSEFCHLKMKFFLFLLINSHDDAVHTLQKLQTHLQIHRLSFNESELYNMRMCMQNVAIKGTELVSSIVSKALKVLDQYKRTVAATIRQKVELMECNFCGNLVIMPLQQLEQNKVFQRFIRNSDSLKCSYCMATGLDLNGMIIPKAIDVLSQLSRGAIPTLDESHFKP